MFLQTEVGRCGRSFIQLQVALRGQNAGSCTIFYQPSPILPGPPWSTCPQAHASSSSGRLPAGSKSTSWNPVPYRCYAFQAPTALWVHAPHVRYIYGQWLGHGGRHHCFWFIVACWCKIQSLIDWSINQASNQSLGWMIQAVIKGPDVVVFLTVPYAQWQMHQNVLTGIPEWWTVHLHFIKALKITCLISLTFLLLLLLLFYLSSPFTHTFHTYIYLQINTLLPPCTLSFSIWSLSFAFVAPYSLLPSFQNLQNLILTYGNPMGYCKWNTAW